MSWEIISKDEVAKLSGCSSTDLSDLWYDIAVSMVEEYTGMNNISTPASVTDTLDGTGTSVIRVNSPPILSVTSVTIDNVLIPSTSYVNDMYSIQINEPILSGIVYPGNPYARYEDFIAGRNNIVVSYESGISSASGNVITAITLIVREFLAMQSTEGSAVRLQFNSTDRSDGYTKTFRSREDTRILSILKSLLTRRVKAY